MQVDIAQIGKNCPAAPAAAAAINAAAASTAAAVAACQSGLSTIWPTYL